VLKQDKVRHWSGALPAKRKSFIPSLSLARC
jgi:hypothetical protein